MYGNRWSMTRGDKGIVRWYNAKFSDEYAVLSSVKTMILRLAFPIDSRKLAMSSLCGAYNAKIHVASLDKSFSECNT